VVQTTDLLVDQRGYRIRFEDVSVLKATSVKRIFGRELQIQKHRRSVCKIDVSGAAQSLRGMGFERHEMA